MNRRRFLLTSLAGALVTPLAARAQSAGRKVTRLGVLSSANPRSNDFYEAFEHRLRDLGHVEGRNLIIEFRNAEGAAERLPHLAAELVHLKVDVLFAAGPEATLRAAKTATNMIPIVMAAVNHDPLIRGHVESLARPGGNVTGVYFVD